MLRASSTRDCVRVRVNGPALFCRIWTCLVLATILAPPARAQEVFHFIDERGVPHFSNAPRDSRYKPFMGGQSDRPGGRDRLPELALQLSAPDTIKSNAEFSVVLSCSRCISVRGWADISFDPAVLGLADVSTPHYSLADGQVRVELTSEHSQAALSRLLFSPSAYARAPTVLRVVGAELRREDGKLVEAALPPAAHIAITEQ